MQYLADLSFAFAEQLSIPASDHVGCCIPNLAVLSLFVSDAALAAWLIGIMLPFYVRSLT